MALTLFNMNATLGLDSSEFNSGVASAGDKTEGLSAKTVAMGKIMADAFELVIQKVAEYGTKVVEVGISQEQALAKVNTIMDTSVVSTEAMSSAISELSSSMGVSVEELSDTVYNAISATGDTANAVSLAEQASKLATAGFTDTSSALSVLTTAMNAYGLSAEEASAISDSLIQVQNLGVTTVAELSSSMGKAIASASAYGVDLSNLESAYVSITKAGINTAEGTTYISSMLKELGDSGTDVSKILKEKTGKSFDQLMAEGKTLGDVLGVLSESVDGDATALMNLWSSAEAGKASSAIVGQGLDAFNENLEQIANTSGATETAFETMANTMAHKVDVFKATGQNLMAMIYNGAGSGLGDFVTLGTDILNSIMEDIELGDYGSIGWGVMSLLSGAIEDVADNFDMQVINDIVDGFLFGIYDHGYLFLDAGFEIIGKLLDGMNQMLPMLAEYAIFFISDFATKLGENLPSIAQKGIEIVTTLVNSILGESNHLIDGALDLLLGISEAISQSLPVIAEKVPEIVAKIIEVLYSKLPDIIVCAVQIVVALASGLIKAIPQLVKAIPQLVTALVKGFAGMLSSFVNIGANIVAGIRQGIANAWNQLVNWIVGLCSSLVDTVKSFFGIHSPSRVFAGIGENLALGLGVGWEDSIEDVKKGITKDLDFSAIPFGSSSSASGNGWKNSGSVFNQTINVNREISTADELAREIRIESRYGLMVGA